MTDLISALEKETIAELYLATMSLIDVHLGSAERAFQFVHLCATHNSVLLDITGKQEMSFRCGNLEWLSVAKVLPLSSDQTSIF